MRLIVDLLALFLSGFQGVVRIEHVVVIPLELVFFSDDFLKLLFDLYLFSDCLLESDVKLGGDLVSQTPLLRLNKILQLLDLRFKFF